MVSAIYIKNIERYKGVKLAYHGQLQGLCLYFSLITLFYIVIADPRYTRLATSWPASRWEVLKIHSLEIARNMVLVNSGLYQQLLT